MVEMLEGRVLFSTYIVKNTNDSGTGSLRAAITSANNHMGADVIKFAIGSGAKTITPLSRLPGLNGTTTLDGTSQPGYAGKPLIEINGSRAGTGGVNGVAIVGGGGSVVKGLVINRFSGYGIFVRGPGSNLIAGNYIGTDRSGAYAAKNKNGVYIQCANNTVGGTTAASRNIISGNEYGVFLWGAGAKGNKIQGNYIGTDVTGARAIPNTQSGMHINAAPGNTVGGTVAGARNLISGNQEDGVIIVGTGASGNLVQGNYIGTDVTGTKAVGNGMYGVEISQTNNVVGGTVAAARNIISGNRNSGVALYLKSCTGNKVQGNYIGTDVTGTKDLGNAWRGVDITNGALNNVVGGTTAATRNVISGNDVGGIGVFIWSINNLIQGNLVGLAANGTSALGNRGDGIYVLNSPNNTIGGSGDARNFICSNGGNGMVINGNANYVLSNSIGVNCAGASMPNGKKAFLQFI